ncbi:cell wall anchor protein [Flavobacterium sp. T12S277]|uniref:cell wall anchor protein n=1 Tax=Flavobacterium sp. T12S277 TaxID=3402752 RepID=UPI003AE00C98
MKKIIVFLLLICASIHQLEAQTATDLSINDTRAINDLPNFSMRNVRADFKERSVIGVPGDGIYSTNLTLSPWANNENSGGKNHQLNFNNGGAFYRNALPTDAQWGAWQQFVLANENGKVGIGTTNPNSRLDLGSGYGTSGAKLLIYNDDTASELSGTKMGFYIDNFTSNNLNLVFPEAISYPGLFTISAKNTSNTTLKPYFAIAGLTGNVGIGTTNPQNKLDVKGTIRSQEVKVTLDGWSDFVFKKEYDLPTLAEVEKHIKEKGHLENIPNEEEVLKNGINLGEMNAKLLQKIEELTLYSIQQSKEIELLKEENKSFKTLSERLSKIEQKVK